MAKSTFIAVVFIAASLGLAAHAQGTGGNGTAVPTPPGSAAGQPLNSDHLAADRQDSAEPQRSPSLWNDRVSTSPSKSRMTR
jgi:hypothetical protein